MSVAFVAGAFHAFLTACATPACRRRLTCGRARRMAFAFVAGAFHANVLEPTPSFVLMDLQGESVTTYVYELHGEEVQVKKIDHTKAVQPAASATPE